jgi:enoyl-CoA hydratase/carnithine racemase
MHLSFVQDDPSWVQTRVQGGLGWIRLDRPKALNSLSLGMVRAMAQALDEWAELPQVHGVVIYSSSQRAFCAGGDIRFFHDKAGTGPSGGSALLEDFFTEEYQLNYALATFAKPVVALIDGVVMGGGMGIAEPARRRIITDQIRMAMPEVNIGLFPDVGGSYFLARCPGRIGEYLAVTGATIQAADAVYAGMADRVVSRDGLAAMSASLMAESFDSSEAFLAKLEALCDQQAVAVDAQESDLARHRESINRHFSRETVPEILASLRADTGPDADWCVRTAALMLQRSPLLMCVSLEEIRRGRGLSLPDCLRMERNLVRRNFEHGEIVEGVRALVIDKDNQPRWNPPELEQVDPAMVARFFEPAWPARAHPLRDLGR